MGSLNRHPTGSDLCSLQQKPKSLYFSQDQAAGNDVMQRLLLFREARHRVANPKWDKSSNNLGKIAAACTSERDSSSFEVRNDQTERHLSERSLIGRALHPGV